MKEKEGNQNQVLLDPLDNFTPSLTGAKSLGLGWVTSDPLRTTPLPFPPPTLLVMSP